ncbi:hypothetical protein C8J57DRAFT_1470042 [Mycena rebaudengoi]|nr:hypothetical protein C8J57DRAFT_1470042 [Mycena rebaudengoi]
MTTFAHFFGYTIDLSVAQPTLATEDGKYLLKYAPDARCSSCAKVAHNCLPGATEEVIQAVRLHRVAAHSYSARCPSVPSLAPLPRFRQHPCASPLPTAAARAAHHALRARLLYAAHTGLFHIAPPPRARPPSTPRAPHPPRRPPTAAAAPFSAHYATAFSSSAERVGSRTPSPAFPHDQNEYRFPTRVTTRSERFLSRTSEFAEPADGGLSWNRSGGRGDVGLGTSMTYRPESRQGWSGEWGGAAQGLGMDEVVNRLRGLKMK